MLSSFAANEKVFVFQQGRASFFLSQQSDCRHNQLNVLLFLLLLLLYFMGGHVIVYFCLAPMSRKHSDQHLHRPAKMVAFLYTA